MPNVYNYGDIFGDSKDGYKPSYLRDVVRVHYFQNQNESRKEFFAEREDQFEEFFSKNFQDQIENRTRSLDYQTRERITREAVFEQANYNYTNKLLGATGSTFNRIFNAFQTPDLFQDPDDSARFSREILHDFTNALIAPTDQRYRRITEELPLPAKELADKFDQTIERSINTAEQSSRHINKDIADFQRRNATAPSFTDYSTNGGVTKSKNLLDNVGYINRPGILPAIGMIHDAKSELSINIYQLQNKPIIDYLTADLKTKAEEYRANKREKFTFNLQLAWNEEVAQNEDSIRILTPNMIAIRTFQALEEKYKDYININIIINDRRNHTKLLFSDEGAYISTQNQTAPVGKSLYQAGSNYETGRYVRNLDINSKDPKDRAEGKIYQQIKQVHNRMFGLGTKYEQKILSTGLPNVGAAVETYEVLKASLAYLHEANDKGRQVRADFILDQVFLLQHDSLLFDKVAEGEMGPESKSVIDRLNTRNDYQTKKDNYRSELQEPLLRALIDNTATVTADPRNYRKNVQEPIFSLLMQDPDYINSGYNLTKYLGINPNDNLDVEAKIQQVMSSRRFNRDRAIQLLAIESGNIQPANVPRQHVKAFAMYELDSTKKGFDYNGRNIIPLGDSTSSSNMGLHSTGEGDTVNNELGTYHLNPEVRARSDVFKAYDMNMSYALSDTEESIELVEHTRNILTIKDDLTVRRVNGQLQYTNVNNRAEYERSTDRAKLTELFNQLDAMNKEADNLMKISYDFDNYGPIAVKVEVNSQLNYKFTYGQGFISEVNKSLVIGNSEFVNQSSSKINLGFKDERGNNISVEVGGRESLSPIQTTMSMISSIALESEQIRLIRAPLIEYRENYAPGLEGNDAFDTGLGRYLLNLSGYGDKLTNDVLHQSRVDETSVVIGALTNLQARMKNADPTLDKVRQLAGIDITSQSRLDDIADLNKLINVFASAKTDTDRKAVLTGEGLESGTPNIKSFMVTLFQSPDYADLLYDFINSQGDLLYRQSVNEYVKEVSTRVFDPYLNRTQVTTYSSTQAYRQRPLYGVNQRREGFADSINRASAETQANLTKLGAFALAASPFEHDATSDLGKGNNLLYIPITGTGGSREKSGLEYGGYHNYKSLHPYYQHKKIGTVTALDIIQDAGVGSIITRQGIEEYNKAIKSLGKHIDPDSILGENEDTLLLFNFDVKKKASQIPQRIKNVIGSRPTRELTEVYQNLVEGHAAFYKGIDGRSNQQVKSISQLHELYLTDLRTKVGNKKHLIDDSYSVGIEEGGQIRATLSSDLAAVLEMVREDIEKEFDDLTITQETKKEILRVRLVQADRSAHALRGFIGSSNRKGDSVVLFQLSGAYSDYSILNPEFGGEHGMRTTFSDRAVKGQKSSQISSQRLKGETTDFNVAKELLIDSGSFAKQDTNTGLFHIYSFDEAKQEYIPTQVVSSRKEASIFKNLIEAVRVDPTLGNLNFTSNAASFEGVDAIEILKDIRILEGGVESNEIRVELNYNRSQKAGGGGRQESLSGGLAKMVPIYLYDQAEDKPGLLKNMFNQFNQEKAGSFREDKLDFHQFYGVVNPSNLKSYFYEHGAKILIDQSKKDALLNTDAKKLAASLLMAFGTSKFGNAQINDTDALDALGRAAASGELGTFYKDQYTLSYIQNKGESTEVNKSFIKSVKNISSLQVRTLDYIGLDLITEVLKGNSNRDQELKNKLTQLLRDYESNVVKSNEYVDIGKDRGRELSILAASLDYFVQLTEAKPHDIAVLNATMDNVAYRSLGTIGGISYEDLKKDQEKLSNLVNQLGRRSYVVGMRMSMSGSQSKVAISSKLDSFIENQHLIWEPFYTDAKKFKGGALGSLRQLLAGFFGAMTGTHTGQHINKVTNLQQIDILSPQARGGFFKSTMLGVYNDPGIENIKFKELQRNYEMFETLHSVAELDDNTDLVEKIIKVYRAKSKGQDIYPTELNKHLDNIVDAAKDPTNKTQLIELINQGRYYAFNHFERMYADFRLDPDKRTNAGQAISSGLQRSAGNMGRFAFSFPHLEFTDDGVKVYKNFQHYSFSLAGEDMKIIGESYGEVDNPLQKSQLIVWQAFAPGSVVGQIFDRIAATKEDVFSINELGEEEHNKLSEFYTTATLYPDELTDALGVFANKIVGGSKIGFAGGTTTPAAWFMGSTTATILPEAILARHGGGNTNRMRVHQGLVDSFKNLETISDEANTLNQSKKILQQTKDYYSNRFLDVQERIDNKLSLPLAQGKSYTELKELRADYFEEKEVLNVISYIISERESNAQIIHDIEELKNWNNLLSTTEYEKRVIGRELSSVIQESNILRRYYYKLSEDYKLSKDPKKDLDDLNSRITFLNNQRDEISEQIKQTKLERDLLKSNIKEVKSSYGIYQIEKQLKKLSTENYAVNLEIKRIEEQKYSLIKQKRLVTRQKKYLVDILNGEEPSRNFYHSWKHPSLVKQRVSILSSQLNYLHENINRYDSYIEDLRLQSLFLAPNTPAYSERAQELLYPEYVKTVQKLNEVRQLRGLNLLENNLEYTEKHLSSLYETQRQITFDRRGAIIQRKAHYRGELGHLSQEIKELNKKKQNKINEINQIQEEIIKLSNSLSGHEAAGDYIQTTIRLKKLSQEIKSLNSQIKEAKEYLGLDSLYEEKNEYSLKTKELQSQINEVNSRLYPMWAESKEKRFLTSAINTLNKGISAEATVELNALLEASREFDRRIREANGDQSTLTQIIQEIEGVGKPESTQTIGYYREQLNVRTIKDKDGNTKQVMGSRLNQGGDSFVSLLGLYEMRALRAEALRQGGFEDPHRGVAIENLLEQADTYKSLISPIDGLLVGINNKDSIYVTPEELIGEMRRGSSKLQNSIGLTYENIAGLEGKLGSDYLNKIVKGINDFAETSIKKLQEAYTDSSSIKLAEGTIDRLNEMRDAINSYSDRIDKDNLSKYEVADLALLIQTDVERYHAEIMLGSSHSMRPMPMGNPYSGRAIYDVFRLTDLNNLMSEYNLPISFTPVTGDNRNKTLHLFNPHSWLAAHLGDFDGDMITNMFRATNQLSLKVKSYDALLENVDSKKTEIENRLATARVEGNTAKETELNQLKEDLEKKRKDYEGKQTELNATITNITNHKSIQEYQIAAAKWVGNYLKVDYRVFLASDLPGGGGYRNPGDSIPPEVLFTFTEQGRGLFGGMENIVSKSKDLFNDINTLANKVDRFKNYDNIEELLIDISEESGLSKLLKNEQLREGFLNDLEEAIKQKGTEAGAALITANLFAAQSGIENIQKYNLKGIDGANMTPAIFEAMEHTLGQAGSVILGKSYNTMVGMLYTEAPTLAMSYAVLNDDGRLKNLIVSSQGQPVWDNLYAAALQSRGESEGMGSFLQATQQILRDSIKPKDAISYLDELKDALNDYKNAEEGESRNLAYQSIVEKFGPGPGLKALIEMESLVLDDRILNYAGSNDNDILKRDKTLEKYELTSSKMNELEARLGYNSINGNFDKLSAEVNSQIKKYNLTKEYVLAAYKTKQNMVSVISDFAFDKGYASGESTGFSMKTAFEYAINNKSLDTSKIDNLISKAEEYIISGDRANYLSTLEPEYQAFIEALTHRGLGKTDSISENERKFNDLWEKDLTSRKYAAHTWMETNKQFATTVGEYGEMFIRFGIFNQARRQAYAGNENIRETYFGLDDPLAIAQLMGMTNDKIDPSMVGNLFNSLVSAARTQTGNANPTMEDIYKNIGIGAGLNETEASTTIKQILLGGGNEDDRQKVTKHLLSVAETMSIGQQTASIQEFVKGSSQKYNLALGEEILKNHYMSLGSEEGFKFTEEEAAILAQHAMRPSYSGAYSSSSSSNFRSLRPNKIGRVLGSLGSDSDVKAQGFLFPLLGLVGAALSTGDLTPEAFQMAAGTALQNLSYVRWSNLEKNFTGSIANVVAGTSFKMRLALQESEGDAGKAIWAATTRELTMAGVSIAVNTLAPKHIDKMLGGGETLDFDRYQSGRTLLTSTLTAIASTILGMAINNTVVNRMVSPDASYVSKELAAVRQQQLQTFNTNQEESEEGITVEGADGELAYNQLNTWTNDTDYQLGMDVSEGINFAFNNEPNTVYEFQLYDV